jgi:hypothetical protein
MSEAVMNKRRPRMEQAARVIRRLRGDDGRNETNAAMPKACASASLVMIFDGGYGTSIQKYGLTEADYRGTLGSKRTRRAITTCCA